MSGRCGGSITRSRWVFMDGVVSHNSREVLLLLCCYYYYYYY